MNTIGTFLENARREKNISLDKLEEVTKIKKNFLLAIENENWEELPEYPVVLGFVRNIADALDISTNSALALLRRDYPPKDLKIAPSPDVEKKFTWSPKLTFALGIGFSLLIILGYLGLQYSRFTSSPKLEILKPKEEEIILSNKILVKGKTETDAKLEVNNQPVIVDEDGNFEGEIEISKDSNELIFKATSRSGKQTEITRKISVEFD